MGMKSIASGFLLVISVTNCFSQKIKDIDNNLYDTVRIGKQTWFAKNLITSHYNDGTPIPKVTVQSDWAALKTPGYCWYGNDENSFKETYGALYNGYVVKTNKICPNGWHVPSSAEWSTLFENAGGVNIAAGKLKEMGTTLWESPNSGATNQFGFTALPSGHRAEDDFFGEGLIALWWSSTEYEPNYAWTESIQYSEVGVNLTAGRSFTMGLSVRCLKNTDQVVTGTENSNAVAISVYPNPVNDYLHITLPSEGKKSIMIYASSGNQIISITTFEREIDVDVRHLYTGLYMVEVQTQTSSHIIKVVKK